MKRLNKKNIQDILALTYMQEGMLFHYLEEPVNELYREQLSLDISGEIDLRLFEKAWDFVIGANEMLRAVFRWDGVEKPVQIILNHYKLNPRYVDLSGSGANTRRQLKQLEEIRKNDREKKFDLQDVPFRLILCKLQKDKYRMIISNHHILYDGWSTGIILEEFFRAYDDLFHGRELHKPVKSAFKEFVRWNRDRGTDIENEKKFWRNYLSGFEPRTGPPVKVKRRQRKKIASTGNYRVKLADDLKDKLAGLVKSCNITAASLFYSVWGLFLQKINSSGDVIFDTTVSGRNAKIKGIEDIVGLFINTLPLRVTVEDRANENAVDFLSRTYRMLQQWSEFEGSSLLHVNEYIDEHLPDRKGLFDSVVVIENYPLDSILLQENSVLSVESYSVSGTAPYDLTVLITVFDDITLDFTYNDRLFDRETTVKLAEDVVSILKAIIENPRVKIPGLLLLPGALRDFAGEDPADEDIVPYAAPRDPVEEKLAGIWAGLYRMDKSEIGIDTNFFDLGGHSLKAGRLCGAIHKELGINVPLAEVFRFPTIRKLAGYITRTTGDRDRLVPLIPVKPTENKEYHPLAPAQKRLYMLQQLNPGSTFYNGPLIMRLQGRVDKERIALVFKRLIRRHESLRTAFIEHHGEPVQAIRDDVEFEINYLAVKEGEDIVRNFIRPFDLSKVPLLRAGLIETGNLEYLLVMDMHHIITDGTSRDILTREFTGLYRGETLPALTIQYKDFSGWQNRRLSGGELKNHEEYWLKNLGGELPVLNLCVDFPRPVTQRFAGERISFELPGPLARQLRIMIKETGTTLYMVLMAAYSILLSRYGGQEDILVGVPAAGRNHADLAGTVGLFLETLVIRTQPGGNKIFKQFLEEVKHTALTANEHQDYPFSELVRQAAAAKTNDLSRNPLFDVMLNVLNQDGADLEIEGVKIIPYSYDAGVSKVDITLEAVEKGEKIELELEYCTDLFKRETMERLARHFLNVVRGVVYHPGIRLGDMEIIGESEKKQILEEFNNTADEYAGGETVMHYFAGQVKRTPDAGAVTGNAQMVTYNELNQKSGRLARMLREKGVLAGSIVGIMVHRSIEMITGILGILKAGGAYLPINPDYPQERIDYMLKDSGAKILLTELPEGPELHHSSNQFIIHHCNNLAYIIYTSGSTGRPKGVMVSHKNLAAYIHAFTCEFEIKAADVVLQQASFCFDAFVEEVFPCLVKGGTLALPDEEEVRDTGLLSRFIARHGVTIIDCSPLMLNELNNREQDRLRTIHTFISGGDVLKREYIDNLLEISDVYNTYGPTETTVCASYHRVKGSDGRSGIPIGKPIRNYRVYILDSYRRVLPIGITGEICISGVGVTMGYLNRPELTAEKFCLRRPGGSFYKNCPLDPRKNFLFKQKFLRGGPGGAVFSKSAPPGRRRHYQTGDLGKWLPDGSIEFSGRKDRQVSVRGFRIELGEIENRLLAHEDIENAVVVAMGAKAGVVCAYFIARTRKTVKEMKEFLSQTLPDYMVPAYFVQMEAFPRGAGGKINTGALPDPTGCGLDTGVEYTPPESEIERKLLMLWQEILGLERIGTADDFFDLGGDSILANRCIAAVREMFNVEIPLRTFFAGPSIKALAEEIEKQDRRVVSASESISIGKAPEGVNIPLSFPQERLWFLQNLDPENTAYFVPRVFRIKGELDVELLERTFTEIIRRHEILRTVFVTKDGQPVQHVKPPYDFRIPVMDWSGEEEPRQCREVGVWIKEEGRSPFDFEKGPLLRVTLLKLKEHEHLLVLTEHHLVHDGWTQGVLLNEFITIFSANLRGNHHGLPELPIQYGDFAYWQRNYLQGEVLENHLNYWKEKLAGLAQVLGLPGDRSRPAVMSGCGALKEVHLSAPLTRQLKDFSRNHGVTLFMTMLAVFKVLLYRYTGTGDLCVGTGIANRRYKEIEGLLGMVINTVPLRTQALGSIPFAMFLQQVKESCLEAYQHQDTPFDAIVRVMAPERSLSYNPLFQVMFNFMDTPGEAPRLPGLELHLEPSHNRSSKFDLNIVVVPPLPPGQGREGAADDAGETLVEWEYNTDIFDDSTMDRMLTHYIRLLEEIVNHPGKEISALPMMAESEITRLLLEWNRTGSEYPRDKTLHELFSEQAARTPDAAAVVGSWRLAVGKKEKNGEMVQITYGELNQRSNQLAYLLREKGVAPDTVVGIMVERSLEMIIGIFGILKAGGAYLPMDTGYPRERIDYMLKDSNARILVSEVSEVSKVSEGTEIVSLSELSEEFPAHLTHPTHPTQLCYIIYTSGSTGKPKGVMLRHRPVVNRINWMQRAYPLGAADVILQKTTYVFDVSVWELFWWSFVGSSLCLLGHGEEKNPGSIVDFIARHRVTTLHFVPSMLNAFLEYIEVERSVGGRADRLASLRRVFCSGEALMAPQVRRFHRLIGGPHGTRLVNLYGPTEAAVDVSYYNCDQKEYPDNIPIGKPIDNIRLYVLDSNGGPQPLGVAGELCIAGVGLAMGYVNRPELTAEKFDRDLLDFQDYRDAEKRENYQKFLRGGPGGAVFSKSAPPGRRRQKLYKTGDLARWLADGNIEFLGRIDHQVKIRGFRIEPGEIEAQLLDHEAVREVVVIPGKDDRGNRYLCAYVACVSPGTLESGQLRDYLSGRLPYYMVPAYFVFLEELPLTPNGKVNRGALPAPEKTGLKVEARYAAPRDAVEKKLVEVWCEILGRDRIGIHDNFFAIGGDSIKIIQVSSRMNMAGYKIGVGEIFRSPRIADLAPLVKKSRYVADQSVITGEVPLTPIQHFFFRGSPVGRHHYNHAVIFYSQEFLEEKAVREIFTRIQRHHDALRMTFVERDGKIIQENNGLDHPFSLEVYDLRNLEKAVEELEKRAGKIQAGIDLGTGPLMKLGLFHLDDGDRLLIVIHHLVVDGVSWRILFEDIGTLYRQYKNGEALALPAKTVSFKRWAEELVKYAGGKLLLKEKKYWQKLEASSVPKINKDFDCAENRVKNSDTLSMRLSEEETEQLLTRANEAFNTGINDILLTALGLGIKKTFGHDKLLIALEGHGREEIIPGFAPGRTIGWFTGIYPVVLEISNENDLAGQLRGVKETLRRIPNNGIGYGILKYLAGDEYKEGMDFKLKPRICFNYGGQFDTDVGRMSFCLANESAGSASDPERVREYELDISGMVSNRQLVLFVRYCGGHYKPGTINTILNNYKEELLRLISFCITREERESSFSDFTYKGLSMEQVEGLCRRYAVEDIYTLSPMQEGMLFHWLYDRESGAYFEQMCFRLAGRLDIDMVKRSLEKLCERHDILRTVFVHEGLERPVQVVLKQGDIDFIYKDIREIDNRGEKENFVNEYKKKDRGHLFDLSSGVPLRLTIIRTAENDYRFTWSYHHILMDGWCLNIVIAEFKKIYRCYLENKPVDLPGVKPYKNYIKWWEDRDKEESRIYWRNYLKGYEETAVIPGGKFNGTNREYKAGHMVIDIGTQRTAALENLWATRQVTLNIVMQSIWGIVLSRYNGKGDVVFGSVVSGRPPGLDGIETMVGLFINTVPVRIGYEGKTSFYRLLSGVHEEAINAGPHHYFPLAEIQAGSGLKQDLLDHIMVFESYPIARHLEAVMEEGAGGVALEQEITDVEFFEQANYDFCLGVVPGSRVQLVLKYNANVHDRDFIGRIAGHIQLVIDGVTGGEDVLIKDIALLAGEEKRRVLEEFNNTAADFPGDKTLDRLFEEEVERTPDHVVLVGEKLQNTKYKLQTKYKSQITNNKQSSALRADFDAFGVMHLTYKELNEESNRVAGLLIEKGIQSGTIVGIMMKRSIEMITGILGILKAGGAYLPIDPDYPQERIDYMLKDSGAKILLTELPEGPGLHHSSNQFIIHNCNNLAYIIYTSGSTGRSKGVMVEHRGVVRLVKNTNYVRFREGDRILQTAPLAFDASTFEIWGVLLNGLTFFLTSKEEILVSGTLKEMIDKYDIAVMWMTSPLFNQVVEDDVEVFAGLGALLVGGDVLSPSHIHQVKKRFPFLEIINGYGPTENTTFSTTFSIGEEYRENIPIGKPIANSVAYIVDKSGRLQPIGVPGELYVGGSGVARGYLNNPGLTAEKFIAHELRELHEERNFHLTPNTKHLTLYKTGDLARWLADGNIEFSGRMDFQVKIRGFRIEPGEIERYLMRRAGIKEAVVLVREENKKEKYLCAYIVFAGNNTASPVELREYLSTGLPDYMIPPYFVVLEKIPLTANGKIDRKMLPKPGLKIAEKYEAPGDETETLTASLWSEVLGIEENMIGLDSNFFELGGHSLKATQLVSGLCKAFNVKLPLVEIFRRPTVRELSAWLRRAAEHKYVSIGAAELKEYYAVSSAQKRLYIIQELDEGGVGYNIPAIYWLEGRIDKDRLERAFKGLIKRHESLRTSFARVGGKPFQVVHEEVEFAIEYYCTTGGVDEIIRDFIRPFNLAGAPLMRAGLIGIDSLEHILMVDMHHIITDGSSMGILIREFMKLYSFADGDEGLPPLPVQYKDFSEWLHRGPREKLTGEQEAYWLREFAGEIPVLDLLTDYPRGRERNFTGSVVHFKLGGKETRDLRQLAKEEDVTMYMLLLAIYNILLSRLSSQEEIIVGTPSAGRRHADLRPLIGMFVNTLALRNYPGENKTFREFLQEIKERTLAAFENQDYPFEDLVEKVADNRDAGRNPLFDVMFTMQNLGLPELEIPGVRLKPYGYETPAAKFDLILTGIETNDHIDFRFEYNASLFKEEIIIDFAHYYNGIIAAVSEDRDIKLGQIDLSGLLEVNVDENITQEISGEFEF